METAIERNAYFKRFYIKISQIVNENYVKKWSVNVSRISFSYKIWIFIFVSFHQKMNAVGRVQSWHDLTLHETHCVHVSMNARKM